MTSATILKIYLAARYSRFPEMQGYRTELEALGFEITSRWINGGHELTKEGSTEAHEAERVRYAQEDFADLLSADCVVSFTEIPRETKTRGGRHVEHGMALALGKRVVVVGYRENVFHCLPKVEFFPAWDEAKSALAAAPALPLPQGDEDQHRVLHLYEDDSAFVVRGNGNKTLHGVQRPELLALLGDTDELAAKLIDEFEEAAKSWGWYEDSGTGDESSEAHAACFEARAKLVGALTSLREKLKKQGDIAEFYHGQNASAESSLAAEKQRNAELARENEDNRKGFEFHAGRAERERDRAEASEHRAVELTAARNAHALEYAIELAATEARLDEASKWADGWQQACSTAEVLLGIGPCLAADEFPSAVQAYVAAAETQMRAMRKAGRQLANVAYNVGQLGRADAGAIRSLVAAQLEWDAALAPVTTPPEQEEKL